MAGRFFPVALVAALFCFAWALVVESGGTEPARALPAAELKQTLDRKSTRLNSSHIPLSRMPSSA